VPIEALILAEGGTGRLRPLTDHVPTSVLPVGGTPILDHQIQVLRSASVGSITVIGGYRGAQVEQICRAYPSVRYCLNPRFRREEPSLEALRLPGLVARGPLLVVRGDLLVDPELIRAVVAAPAQDCVVVDEERQALGLWRLSTPMLTALLDRAAGADAAEESLYRVLHLLLSHEGAEAVSPNGHPWVRVDSLEMLARALRVQRRIAEARVARTTLRLGLIEGAERASRAFHAPPVGSGETPDSSAASKHAA
jgi:GTP:adenosylcobinamide-phosphate guanylyltransferase